MHTLHHICLECHSRMSKHLEHSIELQKFKKLCPTFQFFQETFQTFQKILHTHVLELRTRLFNQEAYEELHHMPRKIITFVKAPSYKTISLTECGNGITLKPYSNLHHHFIQVSYYSFQCGIGCSAPIQDFVFGYHTLLKCSVFNHIRTCFEHIFSHNISLHTFTSYP